MKRIWLTLTLLAAVLATGCFESHASPDPRRDAGRRPDAHFGDAGFDDDAGRDDDAGICRFVPGQITGLTCVPAEGGSPAYVEIDSNPGLCCETGAPQIRLDGAGPARSVIDLEWLACACCEECNCVSPEQTSRVELVPTPGAVHVVESADGQHRCAFEPGPPLECSTIEGPLRTAQNVFVGEPLSLTVEASGFGGCSCTPELDVGRTEATIETSLHACGCCELCGCVDVGYEASVVLDPFETTGRRAVFAPDGTQTAVTAYERGTCLEASPSALEIVGPSPYASTGPRLWWARTTVLEYVCCAEPAPLVNLELLGSERLTLSVHSCVQEDCDCLPGPIESEAWTSLGELAPGTYTVRAGGIERTFEVP